MLENGRGTNRSFALQSHKKILPELSHAVFGLGQPYTYF
jgi:hypothetical protein